MSGDIGRVSRGERKEKKARGGEQTKGAESSDAQDKKNTRSSEGGRRKKSKKLGTNFSTKSTLLRGATGEETTTGEGERQDERLNEKKRDSWRKLTKNGDLKERQVKEMIRVDQKLDLRRGL